MKTIKHIPSHAKEIRVNLLLPLIDGEKVEQHEAKLQMQSFVVEAQTLTQTPENKTTNANSSSESTEEDMNVLLKELKELDFDHPRIQKNVLQRALKIWSDA